MLTNAIYLKARWRQPFDPHDTRPAPFHTLDGGTPQVPTMHHQAVTLPYAQGDGWQAVELAYKGGALAMDVLLPAAGEFASFQQGLAPYSPVLRSADLPAATTVPWWAGRRLRFDFT